MYQLKSWIIFAILFLIVSSQNLMAQCAMCKTSVANNASHGDTSVASGLNFGIMYLFVTPYLAIAIIGLLWYKKSKDNAKKLHARRPIKQ